MSSPRFRILLAIHHELDPDAGAPGATLDLGAALRAAGHHVSLLSWHDLPSAFPRQLKSLLFPIRVAVEIARSEGFDVVDASTGDAWIWAAVRRGSLRRRGPRLVTRSHGLEHLVNERTKAREREGELALSWKYGLYLGGWRLLEVKWSLRGADLVLLLNEQDREYAVQRLGVPADRAALYRHGIRCEFLGLPKPGPRAQGQPVRIAQIGRYMEAKGIRSGTRALMEVLDAAPGVEVTFLGTSVPSEHVMRDFPLRFRDRVHVVERYRRADLPMLLQGHQVKFFPTLTEGFGLALLEAMACGLAPVTSDAAGPSEIVENNRTGLIVAAGNQGAYAEALLTLIANDERRLELQRAAHAEAQRASWSTAAARAVEDYRRALAERGATASR